MFLNTLLTPKVGDAATAPQTGPLDPTPSSGMQPPLRGFADAFLAVSPPEQDVSETGLQTALDPSAVQETEMKGSLTKVGDLEVGFGRGQTEPASPDLASALTDAPGASETSAKSVSESAGTVANPVNSDDRSRTPTAGAVPAENSALNRSQTSIGKNVPRQAEGRIETAQPLANTPASTQNETPVRPGRLGETTDTKGTPDVQAGETKPRRPLETPGFAADGIVALRRPTDTGQLSEGMIGPVADPSASQLGVAAKISTTQDPVSLPTRTDTTRSDVSDSNLGADTVRITQMPLFNTPLVGETRPTANTKPSVETPLPETPTRAPEAAVLSGSISPQPERRGISAEELPRLTADTVRVVFAATPATPEPATNTATPPEVSTAVPAGKAAPSNVPSLANINPPDLVTTGDRYEAHRFGHFESVSSHGRGKGALPYQNATPTFPLSPASLTQTADYPPSATFAVSPGLAFNGEATVTVIPEEAAIQPAADAEISRFDLVSRDPVTPQTGLYSRTEQVRHPVVMSQVAEAARTLREGQMEITLVPEELGRVRLTMTPSEAGMAVTIMAERPETLELMRRNIELLARDLSSQGFENLSFSFGGSGADTGGSMPDQHGTSGGQDWSFEADLTDTHTPAPINAARSGLDLRL